MLNLNAEDKQYFVSLNMKITEKVEHIARRIQDRIPFTTVDGVYDDKSNTEIDWWTNGFWSGMLWEMYKRTNDSFYSECAHSIEKKLDSVLYGFDGLHHDVGFMWLSTSVERYTITGDEHSKQRALLAASVLAARFNLKGKFIRAWNGDKNGWAIIDCMMNIPLLYWADKVVGDERFGQIAMAHADTTMQHFVRADGSVNHIVSFDSHTGEVLESLGGQGYAANSSWSRGQAWALYGFALSHAATGKQEYLDTAKSVANYFISNICDDFLPSCDFRQPKNIDLRDSSAGAIAACGLIEIAKVVDENESHCYLNAAMKILRALNEKCTSWDGSEALLDYGTGSYHNVQSHNMSLIYGDYYFMKAVGKLA